MASTCLLSNAVPVSSGLSISVEGSRSCTDNILLCKSLRHNNRLASCPSHRACIGNLSSSSTRWLQQGLALAALERSSRMPRASRWSLTSRKMLRTKSNQDPSESRMSSMSSREGLRVGSGTGVGFYCALKRKDVVDVRCRAAPKQRKGFNFDDSIDPAKSMPPEVEWGDQELTNSDRIERRIQEMRKQQIAENERFRPALKRAGYDEKGERNEYEDEEDEEEEEEEEEDEEEDVVQDEYLGMVTRAPAKKNPGVQQISATSPITATRRFEEVYEDEDDEVAVDDWDEDEEEEEEVEGVGSIQRRSNGGRAPQRASNGLGKESATSLVDKVEGKVAEEEEDFEDDDWEGLDDEDLELEGPPLALVEDIDADDFENEFLAIQKATQEEEAVEEPVYRMTLGELLDEAGVAPIAVEGDLDVIISGIQQDSRQVAPGDLFVCCTGLNTDGHLYAAEAVEKGAAVVLASREVDVDESVKALVMVEDANVVLSALADVFYGRPSQELLVVGITGTNGKTTTSWLIRSMYEAMGLQTGLLGTIMYSIGKKEIDAPHTTPDAVEVQRLMASMVHKKCEACVMEVSSHALALGRTSHVDFDVAVFTNLTRDHMDFHKSEEDYREAKLKLFDRMQEPDHHRKVVNIDDPNAQHFLNRGHPQVPIVTYAVENDQADVFPLEVSLSLFETELVVRTPKGSIELSSGLLGRHNVSNILAAIAVGVAVEAPLEDIVKGIEEVDAVPGRCELIDEEQAFAVLVDYAHTPDALARLLNTVRECGPSRIITVVGCGGDRDKGKRPMMCKIATDKSDVTILTSDNPRSEDELEIIDDMLAGVGWSMEEYLKHSAKGYIPPLPNGHRLFVYDARGVAVRTAVAMGEEGDAVVVAGKGHETYQIIGSERNYFDDREECREALSNVDEIRSFFDTSEIPWRLLDKEKERTRRGAAANN